MSLNEFVNSHRIQELQHKEAVNEWVSYAKDVELLTQSAMQFRHDLESWDAALAMGTTVELVTFLGQRAADSQDAMIARSQAMNLQEKTLASLELEIAGYQFSDIFRERSPILEKWDFAPMVVEYETILPSERPQYAIVLRSKLVGVIAGMRKVEDVANGLSEVLQQLISRL